MHTCTSSALATKDMITACLSYKALLASNQPPKPGPTHLHGYRPVLELIQALRDLIQNGILLLRLRLNHGRLLPKASLIEP